MITLSEIETLLSSRRLDEAEAALAVLLAKSPADAEARMLLGICGQMKGDTDRFCRIYGELAPSLGARAEAGEESPVIARWRNYLRVATYLVALGVITLTGVCQASPAIDRDDPDTIESEPAKLPATADQIVELPEFRNFPAETNVITVTRTDGTRIWIARVKQEFKDSVPQEMYAADPYRNDREVKGEAVRLLQRAMPRKKGAWKLAQGAFVVREDISRVGSRETIDIYMAIDERMKLMPEPRPHTRYNMRGRDDFKPRTKYAMGGRPMPVILDDDEYDF